MGLSTIASRRQELIEERTTLESIRAAIVAQLPVPETAKAYITSQLGQDGSRMHGDQIKTWIDDRLTQVDKELRRLPTLATKPVAMRMNVLGKDLSQYAQQ